MRKTIVIVGYGPGISNAVAQKFGGAGFSVALIGRNAEKLAAGVQALEATGIAAASFVGEAGDPESIRGAIAKVRASFGPITAIQWSAYGTDGGDLLTAASGAIRSGFDVAVVGLLVAVQEALPDLRAAKGSILITNGAFGDPAPQADEAAVSFKSMGLAVANAAKAKLVGVLAQALKTDGVFVGEVMVSGLVKGTAWDHGNATIEPAAIANKFWELHEKRKEIRARVS